jgi:hypothetical protein
VKAGGKSQRTLTRTLATRLASTGNKTYYLTGGGLVGSPPFSIRSSDVGQVSTRTTRVVHAPNWVNNRVTSSGLNVSKNLICNAKQKMIYSKVKKVNMNEISFHNFSVTKTQNKLLLKIKIIIM